MTPVRARLARAVFGAASLATRTVVEPLPCPEGWRTGPPDFVGVGAQRAGTTWWYGLLIDHPAIRGVAATRRRLRPLERLDLKASIPTPGGPLWKELHFFESLAEGDLTPARVALYHDFFPRPSGSIAGEWTPRYMFDFWTPALLQAAASEAKILVMLRDPVERFRSGLEWEERVARARGRRASPDARDSALDRCRYGSQLDRLLEHFGRDRLLVLQYERCVEDPTKELRRTYRFLGAEPADHAPKELGARPRPRSRPLPAEGLRRQLVSTLAADVERAAELFPAEIELRRWPEFKDLGG